MLNGTNCEYFQTYLKNSILYFLEYAFEGRLLWLEGVGR